ncbi:two-component system sensor histidine kinase DesK [Saccharothrix ecbatanensis]|uniref:Two-component system sensor histidine kinase DesK n=1 Tax=Saccharothrix ecbatanensis TaxID=1105145 RepID=A0A7W9M2F5_9PSEU|nr:histidine kinase [Saccharothrix ecbatanensis]MBB5804868.1 two-component system sensor histidine kinase DesK [Saccharothrix ecbatanensis]
MAAPRMMRRARVLTLVSLGVAWSTSLTGPGIGVLLEPRPVWQVLGLVGVVLFSVAHAGVLYAAVTPVARAPWDAAFVVASLLSVPLLAPVAVGRWDTWAWVGASLVGTAPVLVRRWWVMAPFVVVVAVVLSPEPLRALVIAGGVGVGLALMHVLPVWLWDLVVQAQQGREARARLAVIEERLRFARDVHDLLGHRLTVIALKAELAARLADVDASRAGAEAGEVRELAASALADLREAVHGYRAVELDEQASAIEQVLTSSGVRCTVSVPSSLPPAARELSWALREAGTNVLRHSRARWCTIEVVVDGDDVRLTVANDGATGARGHGSGLGGLAERLAEVGGSLRTGEEDGVFTLVATVRS